MYVTTYHEDHQYHLYQVPQAVRHVPFFYLDSSLCPLVYHIYLDDLEH